MSIYNKIILKFIKQAYVVGLFLIFFLLLPFVFSVWIDITGKPTFKNPLKIIGMLFVLITYISCLLILLRSMDRDKMRETAREKIVAFLDSKQFEEMSFEALREHLGSGYSDEFLISVIEAFPEQLRFVRFNDGSKGMRKIKKRRVFSEKFSGH